MRISTSWAQQTIVTSMLNQQSKLSQTQMQISTGKKILTPSDDPAAASQISELNQSIKQAQQYQSNSDAARRQLTLEDTVLQSATDILQKINELGLQGLSDTSSSSTRANIATEMKGLNQQLLDLANTKNANGEYLFSGFKGATQSFSSVAGGGYSYDGDSNQRSIQISDTWQIAEGDPGINVFGVPTGPPLPAPGSKGNIFETIDRFSADLANNTPQSASLGDVSSALNKITAVRLSVGTRLNELDVKDEINSDLVLNMQATLSSIQDLDYASAISQLSQQTISLQAAQQAFAQVKKLSLFNYL